MPMHKKAPKFIIKHLSVREVTNTNKNVYLLGYLIGGDIFFNGTLFILTGRVLSGLSIGLGNMVGLVLMGFVSLSVLVSNIFLYVLTTSGGGNSPFVVMGGCSYG